MVSDNVKRHNCHSESRLRHELAHAENGIEGDLVGEREVLYRVAVVNLLCLIPWSGAGGDISFILGWRFHGHEGLSKSNDVAICTLLRLSWRIPGTGMRLPFMPLSRRCRYPGNRVHTAGAGWTSDHPLGNICHLPIASSFGLGSRLGPSTR